MLRANLYDVHYRITFHSYKLNIIYHCKETQMNIVTWLLLDLCLVTFWYQALTQQKYIQVLKNCIWKYDTRTQNCLYTWIWNDPICTVSKYQHEYLFQLLKLTWIVTQILQQVNFSRQNISSGRYTKTRSNGAFTNYVNTQINSTFLDSSTFLNDVCLRRYP